MAIEEDCLTVCRQNDGRNQYNNWYWHGMQTEYVLTACQKRSYFIGWNSTSTTEQLGNRGLWTGIFYSPMHTNFIACSRQGSFLLTEGKARVRPKLIVFTFLLSHTMQVTLQVLSTLGAKGLNGGERKGLCYLEQDGPIVSHPLQKSSWWRVSPRWRTVSQWWTVCRGGHYGW